MKLKVKRVPQKLEPLQLVAKTKVRTQVLLFKQPLQMVKPPLVKRYQVKNPQSHKKVIDPF